MASGSMATEELEQYYQDVIKPRENRRKMFYELGVRGQIPKLNSGMQQFLEAGDYSDLYSVLHGAIDASRPELVSYLGLSAIARERIDPECPQRSYRDLWQAADEFLAGQQGSNPVE